MVTVEEGESPKPGFVVADVVLQGGELTRAQARYFVEKCGMMRAQPRTRPFMSLLVASRFAPDAFQLGKSKGLLFTTPEHLFGKEVAEALDKLLQTLTDAAAVAVKKPERIGELFNELSRIEGAAQKIRGPLFEMIVAHCVNQREGFFVDIGKRVTDPDGNGAEIDVFCDKHRSGEVLVIECKGVQPGGYVSYETVKKWLTKRVPRVWKWLLSQDEYRHVNHRFEIWTSGTFDAAAREYLEERKANIRKYEVGYREGEDVRSYADPISSRHHIGQALDEHFLEHPVVKVQG